MSPFCCTRCSSQLAEEYERISLNLRILGPRWTVELADGLSMMSPLCPIQNLFMSTRMCLGVNVSAIDLAGPSKWLTAG